MPEQNGSEGQQPPEGGNGGGDGYKPPATQADFDKIVGERVARERAKFADYDALKQRVAEADAEAEKAKTAEQKLNDRVAALEKDNAEKATDALRARLARKFDITDEDQVALLTGPDEEAMTKQAKTVAAANAARKKAGGHVPREGESTTTPSPEDKPAFARGLFGGGD